MSSKRPSVDYEKLREDFKELKNIDWGLLQPRDSPDFPAEHILIRAVENKTDEDWRDWYAYCARLLDQTYETELNETNGEVLLRKASETGRRGRRMALYRLDNGVHQISDMQLHNRHTEVLGRMGIVTIIIEQLQERFEKLNRPRTLTLADVARLTQNKENRVETREKFLSNLNNGHFVLEETLRSVAEALGVRYIDLCFNSFSLYTPAARKSRAVSIRERSQKAHERLKKCTVGLTRLAGISDTAIIERLLRVRRPRGQIEYRLFLTGLGEIVATEAFIDLIRSTRRFDSDAIAKICTALRSLKDANVSVWFGAYEVGREYLAEVNEWVWSEPRLVLAFGNLNGEPPHLQVDMYQIARDRARFAHPDDATW